MRLGNTERGENLADGFRLRALELAFLVHLGAIVLGHEPCVLRDHGEERDAVGKAHANDPHRLEDSRAAQLHGDERRVPLLFHFLTVRLYAANKVHVAVANEAQQLLELLLELGGHALEARILFLGEQRLGLRCGRKDALHKR